MESMSPKERWHAALHLQPVDRLPFWPKLNGSYPPAQHPPFRDMDLDALHDWIGSDKHTGVASCVCEVRSRTGVDVVREGNTMRTVFRSPQGELQLIREFDGPSNSWHPVEFPVKTLEDIGIMTGVFEDARVDVDSEALEQAQEQCRQLGDGAFTKTAIGESPLMYWIEFLAGIENGHYLLADHPREVEALFEVLHRNLCQKTRILCEHSPADVLYMMENTSTTLISPEQYRRYCTSHVGQYADIAQDAERDLVLHMCGHLKDLLPDLAQIPARAFEAFTSPTLGNTTLKDGRSACPGKCLVGGTNAVLWTRPADEIIAGIERDLAELPHHRGLVITSAGVMPPLCKPETIKRVCDWLKQYPARMQSVSTAA